MIQMTPATLLRQMNRLFILCACLLLTFSSCKRNNISTSDQYQQGDLTSRKNKAISDLNQIISDPDIHWKVKTRMLDQIREQYFEDDQLDDLIGEASKKIKQERKLADAKEEEGYFADLKKKPNSNIPNNTAPSRSAPERSRPFPTGQRAGVEGRFDAIASASDQYEARDQEIETLTLFASSKVPVLLIISGKGDAVEYAKPLTIKEYLEYLRDTKKSSHRVASMEKDNNGKISAIELSNY